ncbi:hypothetical protein QUF88_17315 [Bacillus sp. DX1.1]|uniref:hypothetical protein n=1 Tax=unclassified Bacillus (in: firmicutes) TaxID=185979 RepID=UPI0025706728|nr:MULTISPECIES: hypothetical protein [unclassified Bacillus (in: firmicutes)]MDM5155494.1 hypothetical protein [Bacillus sp. DX1.1]WJE79806.1 hypothetical protein QRE67_14840 [Bacillus sp. DX3.1]
MNDVINKIMRCCHRSDDLFQSYISCLLQIKQHSETFQKVQRELKCDYLIRGICEREVEGLIQESEQYEVYYVPKVLHWDFLRRNPSYIENICMNIFTYEALHFSAREWENVMACIEKELLT